MEACMKKKEVDLAFRNASSKDEILKEQIIEKYDEAFAIEKSENAVLISLILTFH